MQAQRLWQEALGRLKSRVSDQSYDIWLKPLTSVRREDETLVVEVPHLFFREWIQDHFGEDLLNSLRQISNEIRDLRFEVNENLEVAAGEAPTLTGLTLKPKNAVQHPSLNSRYTFENFVVGRSNQFAHAACKAVAEQRPRRYNPLFIYGGVGLGKTHLLNAIGHRILERKPKSRIVCLQAESFLNELINSLRFERMAEFRQKYRQRCDVLLMDDIEILAGKDRTQEEFFYTFNGLYESGKTIVITSDRFPKDMPELEERLRSRFESGIIVDIQAPDLETKLAIIRKKADEEQIQLSPEIALFIAENVTSNIRKLEGSLIRLGAFASLSGSEISLDLARNILKNIVDEEQKVFSAEAVMKAAATHFQIKLSDLKSSRRNRAYAFPRQLAMYLIRELMALSYPEIGRAFGGKDHATVIHAYKKINLLLQNDPDTQRHLQAMKTLLGIHE
jgi:chromosomal replication initiator protein